ncbi:lysozyme [Sphingobium sp. EP60837]|uniref:lysozyme n=1 Tax=Sphingobium sp. EP60837 TaxID=1855519 RepID=UPI0007DD3552|nr:lysozyme [Sphingobium sp. EP60837]ANI78998.1 Lysozyme [Sphingobium sp. EP60837]
MLKVDAAGEKLIKSFEGCKLAAYPDPATGGEPWTIGWGSTGPGIRKGVIWTQAQADARFSADIVKFAALVAAKIGDAPTTQGQFNACVSLAYNIGMGGFGQSTLLRLHRDGDYDDAVKQFARWCNANGRRMTGLVRRREAEAKMYRGK